MNCVYFTGYVGGAGAALAGTSLQPNTLGASTGIGTGLGVGLGAKPTGLGMGLGAKPTGLGMGLGAKPTGLGLGGTGSLGKLTGWDSGQFVFVEGWFSHEAEHLGTWVIDSQNGVKSDKTVCACNGASDEDPMGKWTTSTSPPMPLEGGHFNPSLCFHTLWYFSVCYCTYD